MQYQIQVNNVKCAGCVAAIQTGLHKIQGVKETCVEVSTGLVTINGDGIHLPELKAALKELGYPEKAPT